MLVFSLATAAYAGGMVFDPTGTAAAPFSVGEDGVTVTSLILPGDKILSSEIYVDGSESPAAAGVWDDGLTSCWTNESGNAYSVTVMQVDTGVQMTAEDGVTPLFAEDGVTPLTVIQTRYLLNKAGSLINVVNGTAASDTGMASDVSSVDQDLTYSYTDASGMPQSVSGSDISSAVYPLGAVVYLNYNAPADPSQVFQGWTIYAVEDSVLSPLSAEETASLGIPGAADANSMSAEASAASGRGLAITIPAEGLRKQIAFVPQFAAAPVQDPAADPAAADPAAIAGEAGDAQGDGGLTDAFSAIDGNEAPDGGLIDAFAAMEENAAPEGMPAEAALTEDPAGSEPMDGFADQAAAPGSGEYTIDTDGDGIPDAMAPESVDENGVLQIGERLPILHLLDADAVYAAEDVYGIPDGTIIPEGMSAADGIPVPSGTEIPAGTLIKVTSVAKDNLVFAGWTAEGLELDADQMASPEFTFAMPANDVTLTAQYMTPETTAPETTPETTAPETTAPETTAPETTAPETTAPETTAPETTAPETAAPETAAPETTAPETTAPETTAPETTAPETAAPETTAPETAAPETNTILLKSAVVENTTGDVTVRDGEGITTVTAVPESTLTVKAEVPDGQTFEGWNVTGDGAQVADPLSTETTLTVKAEDGNQTIVEPVLTVKAASIVVQPPANGVLTADKTAPGPGEVVTVTAAPNTGYKVDSVSAVFDNKGTPTSIALTPQSSVTYTFTVPNEADGNQITISAVMSQITHTLTVVSGTPGSAVLAEGGTTNISADTPADGYRFKNWTATSGTLSAPASADTTFTMGAADAVVTANYELIPYTLTVQNGSGSGTYTMGQKAAITPNFPAAGKEFDCWTTVKGKTTYDNAYEYYATVTMHACDTTIKAAYMDGPDPNNNKITGLANGAEYLKSTTLTFGAEGTGPDRGSDPFPGDYKYRPIGYTIGGVSGSWNSAPYTTSMAINAVGDYTLTVTFAKDVYDGSGWNPDGTTVTKSITFHVVNALSVQTGDSSPLIPLIIAGGAALVVIIALVVVLKKRKKNEKE